MNTETNDINYLKLKLTESIADYIMGFGEISQTHIFALASSIHNNPIVENDRTLKQSADFIHFLGDQIQKGNDDLLHHDLMEQMFAYVLEKLTIGTKYKPTIV